MKFCYYLPVNIVFGRGRLNKVGLYCQDYGKKALIVTGKKSTKESGVLDRLIKYLKDVKIDSITYDKVPQNPLTDNAIEAAGLARKENCDMVIGVGGGSIMDCAKAAAFLALNDGDISDYIFNKLKSDKALPIVLIPTTCGTGSEGNGFAVLTNPSTGDKKSLRCNAIVPKLSIVDSELMMTMPKSVLAAVGFDAFCHCLEAYISKNSQPLTEIMCVEGMRLIGENLVDLYQGNVSAEGWDAVSLASTLGGMVINTAGVTLAHGMEHPASGLRNIVHGKGLAALTPVIMRETVSSCKEKCSVVSRCLGGIDENDCVDRIVDLIRKLDLEVGLKELGISDDDIPWMTENCLKISAAGIAGHPMQFDAEGIERIYRMAM